jgi:hypothetical protein
MSSSDRTAHPNADTVSPRGALPVTFPPTRVNGYQQQSFEGLALSFCNLGVECVDRPMKLSNHSAEVQKLWMVFCTRILALRFE